MEYPFCTQTWSTQMTISYSSGSGDVVRQPPLFESYVTRTKLRDGLASHQCVNGLSVSGVPILYLFWGDLSFSLLRVASPRWVTQGDMRTYTLTTLRLIQSANSRLDGGEM